MSSTGNQQDTGPSEIVTWLHEKGLRTHAEAIIQATGAEQIDDFKFLGKDGVEHVITHADLKLIPAKKFRDALEELTGTALAEPTGTAPTPKDATHATKRASEGSGSPSKSMKVSNDQPGLDELQLPDDVLQNLKGKHAKLPPWRRFMPSGGGLIGKGKEGVQKFERKDWNNIVHGSIYLITFGLEGRMHFGFVDQENGAVIEFTGRYGVDDNQTAQAIRSFVNSVFNVANPEEGQLAEIQSNSIETRIHPNSENCYTWWYEWASKKEMRQAIELARTYASDKKQNRPNYCILKSNCEMFVTGILNELDADVKDLERFPDSSIPRGPSFQAEEFNAFAAFTLRYDEKVVVVIENNSDKVVTLQPDSIKIGCREVCCHEIRAEPVSSLDRKIKDAEGCGMGFVEEHFKWGQISKGAVAMFVGPDHINELELSNGDKIKIRVKFRTAQRPVFGVREVLGQSRGQLNIENFEPYNSGLRFKAIALRIDPPLFYVRLT